MTFERTINLNLVRDILTEPAVWPGVGDDFSGDPKEFRPNDDPRIWYVLAIEGTRVVGLFTFLPRSTVLWEAHVALLFQKRETRGREILASAFTWMFEHSTAERIIAEIPACNSLAVHLAGWVMRRFGVNRRSFRKHGVLQDLILFGLSKQETKCPA